MNLSSISTFSFGSGSSCNTREPSSLMKYFPVNALRITQDKVDLPEPEVPAIVITKCFFNLIHFLLGNLSF